MMMIKPTHVGFRAHVKIASRIVKSMLSSRRHSLGWYQVERRRRPVAFNTRVGRLPSRRRRVAVGGGDVRGRGGGERRRRGAAAGGRESGDGAGRTATVVVVGDVADGGGDGVGGQREGRRPGDGDGRDHLVVVGVDVVRIHVTCSQTAAKLAVLVHFIYSVQLSVVPTLLYDSQVSISLVIHGLW